MKFRKRPVVIEAVQYWCNQPLPEGVKIRLVEDKGPCDYGPYSEAYIETLEGDMIVNPGDWVITGVKGEKYPCKPDIFAATYEKVEDV